MSLFHDARSARIAKKKDAAQKQAVPATPAAPCKKIYAMWLMGTGIFRDAEGNVYQFINDYYVRKIATVEPIKDGLPTNFGDAFYEYTRLAPFEATIGVVEYDLSGDPTYPIGVIR